MSVIKVNYKIKNCLLFLLDNSNEFFFFFVTQYLHLINKHYICFRYSDVIFHRNFFSILIAGATQRNGVLVIDNAKPSDSGVYICTGSTQTGSTGTNRAVVRISTQPVGKYNHLMFHLNFIYTQSMEIQQKYCLSNAG